MYINNLKICAQITILIIRDAKCVCTELEVGDPFSEPMQQPPTILHVERADLTLHLRYLDIYKYTYSEAVLV